MAWTDVGIDAGRVDLGGGRKLAARRYRPNGDSGGPVLVFTHEGLGAITTWRSFPQELCARLGLRGIAYDRQGRGRSSPPDGSRGRCCCRCRCPCSCR